MNLPVPGTGDPETSSFDFDIVVDGGSGAVHVVHFFYDSSTNLGFACDDRGDLAVSTWDPTTLAFAPLQIVVQGVDPGLLGKGMWDLDAWLDAEGEIHASYRVDSVVGCAQNPNYDPTQRVFYATGSPTQPWPPVTLLEERPSPNPQLGLQISNLVRNANGTLHVASHAADDPQNIHLLSLSGGDVSEQAISIDASNGAIFDLRAAPRGAAQEPMILLHQGSTWLVREPLAP